MLQYKDRFFGIFEGALGASNEYNLLRLSGLTGLKSMILSSDYLASNEVSLKRKHSAIFFFYLKTYEGWSCSAIA
jgi:hypothetical protein